MTDDGKKVPQGRLKRLRQLAGMGAKVGGKLLRAQLSGDKDAIDVLAQQAAERMVATLGEMKGLALKAGQSMAMAADSLPPQAQAMLTQLFAQAPTLPFADIQAVMETRLGSPVSEVFRSIEPTPLAAASLAQVHAAELKTGERVVIKVQYPQVAEALTDDLRNVSSLASLSQLGGALFDTSAYVDEMTREIGNELDYTREAQSMEAYREATRLIPGVVVPRNFSDFTRPGLLVLERLDGPTLQAYCQDVTRHPEAERTALAHLLLRAICIPLAQHRLVHGDAHPGNFLVLPGGRLGVLDYGCIRRLSERYVAGHVSMLGAMLRGDNAAVLRESRNSGFTVDLPDAQGEVLIPELARLSAGFLTQPYDWKRDNRAERIMLLKRHSPLQLARVRPPAEAMLVGRAFEGITYNLRHLQVTQDFTPLARELIQMTRA